MKPYYLLFLLFIRWGDSYAQTITTVPGYYITNSNDSISATVKLPKSIFGAEDFSKFIDKVEIVDSTGKSVKLTPHDIKEYGFLHDSISYVLYSKPMMSKKNLKFLLPVILGPKASVYKLVVKEGGTFYTFEKMGGRYTFLINTQRLNKFKSELREFYKENTAVQQLIDTKFLSKTFLLSDIIAIVQTINKP